MEPYVLQPGEGLAEFGSAIKASRISTGGSVTVIESKTKKLFRNVIPARLERATYSLEGCRSIQLSYGTMKSKNKKQNRFKIY